jgi:hypothetical protein
MSNNELIADFIGLEHNERGYINDPNSMKYIRDFDWEYGRISSDELKFNVDWNWLMIVVKRCDIIISDNDLDEWVSNFYYALSTIEISIVYNTVIEFIKWYNENISNTSKR